MLVSHQTIEATFSQTAEALQTLVWLILEYHDCQGVVLLDFSLWLRFLSREEDANKTLRKV
jgi:hypothetical protein